MKKKYFSQLKQDRYFIENISNHKRNGIFLDIGANDGFHASNTAALELNYGWSGICIEANSNLIKELTANRPNSKIVNCAVWNNKGRVKLEVPSLEIDNIRGNLLSRISNLEKNEDYFKEQFSKNVEIIEVESNTITNILSNYYKFPCKIDYMSLDVEGAEFEALQGIDFNNIDISFMSVEHGFREGYIEKIESLLKPFGYKIHRVNHFDVEFEK